MGRSLEKNLHESRPGSEQSNSAGPHIGARNAVVGQHDDGGHRSQREGGAEESARADDHLV